MYNNLSRSQLVLAQNHEKTILERLTGELKEHMNKDRVNYYPSSKAWDLKYSDLLDLLAENRQALASIESALNNG